MIISHRHKFIFLKTKKTAGTSIEIALSEHCGEADVITPILDKKDDDLRRSLGFRGQQKYRVPFRKFTVNDYVNLVRQRRWPIFYNHIDAAFVHDHVSAEVWNTYTKVAVERDPIDKFTSWFFYRFRKPPRPMPIDVLKSSAVKRLSSWPIYTIDDRVVVDELFDYKDIDKLRAFFGNLLGLSDSLQLPRTKAHYRPSNDEDRALNLGEQERELLRMLFHKEIQEFGYSV